MPIGIVTTAASILAACFYARAITGVQSRLPEISRTAIVPIVVFRTSVERFVIGTPVVVTLVVRTLVVRVIVAVLIVPATLLRLLTLTFELPLAFTLLPLIFALPAIVILILILRLGCRA